MEKLVTFSSPEFFEEFPPSQGGGFVVTHYDACIVNDGGNPNANPIATVQIPREALTPSPVADGYYGAALEIPSEAVNRDLQVFMRETNPSKGLVGPWGAASPTFYGGFPELSPVTVNSVI